MKLGVVNMINYAEDVLFELKRMSIDTYDKNRKVLSIKINNNFNKEELKAMLENANLLVSLLNDRVNIIEDEKKIVTVAYVNLRKEGNSKFITFSVNNVILVKDSLGNIKYDSTGLKKDILLSETFKYKKSDKSSIKVINDFKNNIIKQYDIHNIVEFENDFKEVIERK